MSVEYCQDIERILKHPKQQPHRFDSFLPLSYQSQKPNSYKYVKQTGVEYTIKIFLLESLRSNQGFLEHYNESLQKKFKKKTKLYLIRLHRIWHHRLKQKGQRYDEHDGKRCTYMKRNQHYIFRHKLSFSQTNKHSSLIRI